MKKNIISLYSICCLLLFTKTMSAQIMQLDSVINYDNDNLTNEWVNDYMIVYFYDSTSLTFSRSEHYNWNDQNMEWELTSKTEFHESDSATHITDFSYNVAIQDWEMERRQNLYYNNDDLRYKFIRFNWDNQVDLFIPTIKYEFEHDVNGNIIRIDGYVWNDQSDVWLDAFSTRANLIYGSNTSIIEKTEQSYNTSLGVWENSKNFLYEYNQSGTTASFEERLWDPNTNNWDEQNMDFVSLSYDQNDNYIFWSIAGPYPASWTFTYDLSYSFLDLLLPPRELHPFEYLYGNTINNMPLEFFNNNGSTKFEYIYSSRPLTYIPSNNSGNDFEIYPNPAVDIIKMKTKNEITSINLYNLKGEKIKTIQSEIIDIKNLIPGIYLMEITFGKSKIYKKIVKK